MIHAVKTLPKYFEDAVSGRKLFEVRKHDRDYREGDYLALNEHGPMADGHPEQGYTGRSALFRISYVLDSPEWCKAGHVVLGLKPCYVGKVARGAIPIVYGRQRERPGKWLINLFAEPQARARDWEFSARRPRQ